MGTDSIRKICGDPAVGCADLCAIQENGPQIHTGEAGWAQINKVRRKICGDPAFCCANLCAIQAR